MGKIYFYNVLVSRVVKGQKGPVPEKPIPKKKHTKVEDAIQNTTIFFLLLTAFFQ